MRIVFPLSSLLFGLALLAFSAAGVVAQTSQTTTTQNPFGGSQPPAAPAPAPKKARGTPALKAGQFANEGEAKSSCSGDAVVWVNIGTKVYHHAGASTYGTTKRGAYMCEKAAASAGFRSAKNEKRN